MSLKGRYIQVVNPNLGGDKSKYTKGSYLEIIEHDTNSEKNKSCGKVKHAGTLHFIGKGNRFELGDIILMPEGFNPNYNKHINYEIY